MDLLLVLLTLVAVPVLLLWAVGLLIGLGLSLLLTLASVVSFWRRRR